MTGSEIRQKFLKFFEHHGHALVPSSSLIPDDPSVLLTTAGMQQFKKYYTGERDPVTDFGKKNTATVQKSFRTSDIDLVGDESHLTFFEMLGNFSFGGYFKKEAIEYAYRFLTEEMLLKISYVTIFKGAPEFGIPKDDESKHIWRTLDPNIEVRERGMEDVFWGPTGTSGPCGPTTEIYCKNGTIYDIEVWNIVFNQFFFSGSREEFINPPAGGSGKKLEPLKTPGVDTGMGLERLTMCVQNTRTVFETRDLFLPIISMLPQTLDARRKRIIADHGRAIVFLVADGVVPSNKGTGYILRRLMRRYMVTMRSASQDYLSFLGSIIALYRDAYPALDGKKIFAVFQDEREKFEKTLSLGERELTAMDAIDAEKAFGLFQSYGLPYEVIKDLAGDKASKLNRKDFDTEFEKHQEISRAGVEKKFGGHGLIVNTGELKAGSEAEMQKVLRLHTATHLLQQALRDVLGLGVEQKGSDITPARTRFDFAFPRKLTSEEIAKVEAIVNQKVKEDLPVSFKEMPKSDAEKTGALYFFSAKGGSASGGKEKYPDVVKVYFVGSSFEKAYSKEFCGGPHVAHTGEIGTVKILKEESVGVGVRRIRATVV